LPRATPDKRKAVKYPAAAKSGVELNSADNLEGMEFQGVKEEQRLGMARLWCVETSERGWERAAMTGGIRRTALEESGVSQVKAHECVSFGG
jgi:hypothetical protein